MTNIVTLDNVEAVLDKYKSINWDDFLLCELLTEDVIRKYKNKLNINKVLMAYELSESFLEELILTLPNIDFVTLASYQKLSESFIIKHKDKLDFNRLSQFQILSEDFMRKHSNKVNWTYVSMFQKLSEDFMRKHSNKVNWTHVSMFQKLSEEFILEFKDKLILDEICRCQVLSEQFIENVIFEMIEAKNNIASYSTIFRFQKLSMEFISKYHELLKYKVPNLYGILVLKQKLSEEFIRKFCVNAGRELNKSILKRQKLSLEFLTELIGVDDELCNIAFECQDVSEEFITRYAEQGVCMWSLPVIHNLSEEFMRKYADKLDWFFICKYQKLSEPFIEEFIHKVSFEAMSENQKLSEEFIRKHKNAFDNYWYMLSKNQQLSEEFIREFKDKVYWLHISSYQKLSDEFRKEFAKYLCSIRGNNWLYWTKQVKLNYIKARFRNVYEIVNDEYIVAYKSVRHDGYSHYNFQYKYEIGQEYESHCNCDSDNSSSFGLSAWTKELAVSFTGNNSKILKLHINIEDIGAIVRFDEFKIRAKKIKVVSEEKV